VRPRRQPRWRITAAESTAGRDRSRTSFSR
jgi:hypothetical protein